MTSIRQMKRRHKKVLSCFMNGKPERQHIFLTAISSESTPW